MEEPKPNDKRAGYLINLFYVLGGSHIIYTLFCCYTFYFYSNASNGTYYSDDHLTLVQAGEGLLALLTGGLNLAVVILFLYWFRRAYANLNRVGIAKTLSQDNMTIWGFVIPIMSLFKPYQIMREVWTKTQTTTQHFIPDYRMNGSGSVMGLWWAYFIISGILGQISFRMTMAAETIEDYVSLAGFDIVVGILEVLGVLITVNMIKKVMKIETDMFQAYQNRPADEPRPEDLFPPPILPPYPA